jgi:hypothetical protein
MARIAVRNGIAHLDAVQRDFAAVSAWAAKAGFKQSAVSNSTIIAFFTLQVCVL